MVTGNGTVMKLVTAFVMLIVGISLIGVVATQTVSVTSKTRESQSINYAAAKNYDGNAINETIRFYPTRATEAITGWRADYSECAVGTVIIGSNTNASGTLWVDPTDIVRNSAGYFTLKNTLKVNGSNNITIFTTDYCADGYTTQGWSRSILNLIPGFFALALMGIALGLFYSLGRDAGIL